MRPGTRSATNDGSAVGDVSAPYVIGGVVAFIVGGMLIYLSVRRGHRRD